MIDREKGRVFAHVATGVHAGDSAFLRSRVLPLGIRRVPSQETVVQLVSRRPMDPVEGVDVKMEGGQISWLCAAMTRQRRQETIYKIR